jgi:hypothetical protein
MTQADLTLALEQELQIRGVRFSRANLQEFVADAWPLIRENPDVTFWAREFIERGRTSATV